MPDGPDLPLLWTLTAIMLGIALVGGVLGVVQTVVTNRLGQDVLRDLRNRVFGHLQSLSLRFFGTARTGDLQSRLSSDVGGVQTAVTVTLSSKERPVHGAGREQLLVGARLDDAPALVVLLAQGVAVGGRAVEAGQQVRAGDQRFVARRAVGVETRGQRLDPEVERRGHEDSRPVRFRAPPVEERRVPFVKLGRLVRFDPVEVDAWIAALRRDGPAIADGVPIDGFARHRGPGGGGGDRVLRSRRWLRRRPGSSRP